MNKSFINTSILNKEEYVLENFRRSNQDTCLTHKPNVVEGSWVQSGDLLTDCASSVGGELSLGQNLLIAYMPWEGYNFEDAILISERLVIDDLYTSIHIERYELETLQTKLGSEEITRNIPDVPEKEVANLDSFGIVKLGSWVEEGDILVGKITPINKKKISPYQKLLYSILEKQVRPIKDSSLRAPKGIKAKVIDIKYFLKSSLGSRITLNSSVGKEKTRTTATQVYAESVYAESLDERLNERPRGLDERPTKYYLVPPGKGKTKTIRRGSRRELVTKQKYFYNTKINFAGYTKSLDKKIGLRRSFPTSLGYESEAGSTQRVLKKLNSLFKNIKMNSFNIRYLLFYKYKFLSTTQKQIVKKCEQEIAKKGKLLSTSSLFTYNYNLSVAKDQLHRNTDFNPSRRLSRSKKEILNAIKKANLKKIEKIHIYLAEKRKIQVGDKMAGRHGNKGIVSQILPIQDMPFLPDGTTIDMVLNPLGVPSRMNVGQIYECLLGLAGKFLGENYKVYSFDESYGADASRNFVFNKLYEARTKTGLKWLFDPNSPGKIRIFDGRNGECFDQKVTVGIAYILRLVHMVEDKIHCLTPDHDVLTNVGWVPINEITTEHEVATLNQNGSGELVYQKPTQVHHYSNYAGSLYQIKNSNIDLCVTLNHRMFVKNGRTVGQSFEGYSLIEAKEIIGKHKKYLKNAKNVASDYQFFLPPVYSFALHRELPSKSVDMEAWLTFFGLWIAEGWAVNNVVKSENNEEVVTKFVYAVTIAQNKLRVRDVIIPAIEKLGYNYCTFNEKITINDKQLWSYLRPFSVGAPRKSLPDWAWLLSESQARQLLHAMCLGDGTVCGTSAIYYTSSIKLADDVMRLALHCGWSANLSLHHPVGNTKSSIDGRPIVNKYNVWRLAIIKSKNNPAVNHSHHQNQQVQKEEIIQSYNGSVHCISVPNEVFYVRRNGLPVWTGNSRSTGPYSLVTQQPLRGRSKQGGQRLGEMEVWAIEGYGAAFTLLEMLTIKSDDMTGRMTLWSNLILNKDISIGTPESFKVLICELQALCLDIGLFRSSPPRSPGVAFEPLASASISARGFRLSLKRRLEDEGQYEGARWPPPRWPGAANEGAANEPPANEGAIIKSETDSIIISEKTENTKIKKIEIQPLREIQNLMNLR